MTETVGFATADYAVFICVLAITFLIGVFYAIKDRNVKSVDNYQFGNKQLSPISIGLSIALSFVNASALIGFPSDIYIYGSVVLLYTVTNFLPCLITCVYYLPLYHRLNLKTTYQYLEYRFNSKVRKLMSIYELAAGILIFGLLLYLPPLALESLTPLSFNVSILVTGAIVTLYTAIGGFKAVIWTDTVQSVIMLVGAIATFIRAVVVVGGFGEIWDAMERGGRINHWDFNFDPTFQRTFWTILVGQTFYRVMMLSVAQAAAQRYFSCKSVRDSRNASVVATFSITAFLVICTLTGCAAYTYFENCDPLLNGEIRKYDQMIPLLVSEIFRDAPGMTGLFVAAVYSGTLSSVSSLINYSSLLIMQDIVLSFYPGIKQTSRTAICKAIAFCIGILVTAIAFAFQFASGTIVTLTFTITGGITGPILGIFTLGAFIPWTNTKGAVCGVVSAFAVNLWITIGAFVYGKPPEKVRMLSGSTERCDNVTHGMASKSFFTTSSSVATVQSFIVYQEEKPQLYYTLYAISHEYYIVIGFMVCVIIGVLVSLLTKPNSPSKMDPKLFVPIMENKHLPQNLRKFFRFGVPYDQTTEESEKLNKIASTVKTTEDSCFMESSGSFKDQNTPKM